MPEHTRTLDTLEMVGGALCLDFINTINSRIYPEHDYLRSYADLVGWAARAGIMDDDMAAALLALAKHNINMVELSADALRYALDLRDVLYHVFANLARHTDPPTSDLNALVARYGGAISESRWVRDGNRYVPMWDVDVSMHAVVYPITYSAGDLLLTDALAHLKECPGCGWLFLDTSKNQSRRWCSMNTCGARSKMRRYRAP